MKLLSSKFTLILLCGIAMACNKENDLTKTNSLDITDNWITPSYNENTITFQKSTVLLENEYGLVIKADNSIMERKNSGWCGTPPISYADFEGTWSQNDSMVYINVEFWGGEEKHEWKIKDLNNKTLCVEVIQVDRD